MIPHCSTVSWSIFVVTVSFRDYFEVRIAASYPLRTYIVFNVVSVLTAAVFCCPSEKKTWRYFRKNRIVANNSWTDWVVDTINSICKLRDTSGALVLHPVAIDGIRGLRGWKPSIWHNKGEQSHPLNYPNFSRVCSVSYVPQYAGDICSVNTLPKSSVRFGKASIPYRTFW